MSKRLRAEQQRSPPPHPPAHISMLLLSLGWFLLASPRAHGKLTRYRERFFPKYFLALHSLNDFNNVSAPRHHSAVPDAPGADFTPLAALLSPLPALLPRPPPLRSPAAEPPRCPAGGVCVAGGCPGLGPRNSRSPARRREDFRALAWKTPFCSPQDPPVPLANLPPGVGVAGPGHRRGRGCSWSRGCRGEPPGCSRGPPGERVLVCAAGPAPGNIYPLRDSCKEPPAGCG